MTRVEEPEWDDRSREWALAEQRYQDSLCPLCRLPISVCQALANEDGFQAEPPIRCHATTALEQYRKQHEDEDTIAPSALLWTTPNLREQLAQADDGEHPGHDGNDRRDGESVPAE